MELLANAQEMARDYWKDIPKDSVKKIGFSFAACGTCRLLVSGSLGAAILSGVVGALAAAIHAFVTPLFLKIYDYQDRLPWEGEMARSAIALVGAGYIASAFGDMSIMANLLGMSILYGLFNHIDANRRDLDKSSWFIIFPG